MERPYCEIDGKKYQLVYSDNGTLRFPDDGREVRDLNEFTLSYFNDEIELDTLFDFYINSGTSYSAVYSLFATDGGNNHTVTQGKGECKYMTLHTEDEDDEEIPHINVFLENLSLNELRQGVLHKLHTNNNPHSCVIDMYHIYMKPLGGSESNAYEQICVEYAQRIAGYEIIRD